MSVVLLGLLYGCKHDPIPIPIPTVEHQAIHTIPETKTPRNTILKAWYHTHRKEWEQANLWFQQAVDQAPNDPWIYIHWGDAAQKLNHTDLASQKWKMAFTLILPSAVAQRRALKQKIEENGDFLE